MKCHDVMWCVPPPRRCRTVCRPQGLPPPTPPRLGCSWLPSAAADARSPRTCGRQHKPFSPPCPGERKKSQGDRVRGCALRVRLDPREVLRPLRHLPLRRNRRRRWLRRATAPTRTLRPRSTLGPCPHNRSQMVTGRADSQVVVCGLRVRPALLGRAPPPLRGREAPGSLPACHSLFAYEPSLEFRAEQRPNRVQRSQQTAASTTIRACEQQQPWCLRVLVLDELVNLLRLDELLPVGCRTLRAVPAPARESCWSALQPLPHETVQR